MRKNYVSVTSDKSRKTALLLCLFLGFFGAHRFYVGRWTSGMLYAVTVGLFFVGWMHDLEMIIRGRFVDDLGIPLRQW